MIINEALFDDFGVILSTKKSKMLSTLDVELIKGTIQASGVVMLRGFASDLQLFQKFSSLVTPKNYDFLASYRPPVTADRTVTEVSLGNHPLYLHGESYFTSERPDIIWLYCAVAPSFGGATTICDGSELLKSLSRETVKLFTNNKIRYEMMHDGQSIAARYPGLSKLEIEKEFAKIKGLTNINVYEDNSVTYSFLTSAIVSTLFGNKPAFINDVVSGLDFLKRAALKYPGVKLKGAVRFEDQTEIPEEVIEEIKYAGEINLKEIIWQSGDIVIIDNHRFMHGRRGFVGERKIFSKLCGWEKGIEVN